jgi:hypothetical protein
MRKTQKKEYETIEDLKINCLEGKRNKMVWTCFKKKRESKEF